MILPKFKEPIAYFDCDDTLVSWGFVVDYPREDKMEFKDPSDGSSLYLKVIQEHVEALKLHKLRGHTVIVWSAGRADWAQEVVTKLGLNSHVDAVMSKPNWFYDDIPASEFMPEINRKDLRSKNEK